MKKSTKSIHLTVTDEQDKFLEQLAEVSGLKSKQKVLISLISVTRAYKSRRKQSPSKQSTIEEEVSTIFDELSADSAMLSELNGWTCHQGGRDDK